MVVVSMLLHAEYGRNEHQENAPTLPRGGENGEPYADIRT